jgi:hypothetical protein
LPVSILEIRSAETPSRLASGGMVVKPAACRIRRRCRASLPLAVVSGSGVLLERVTEGPPLRAEG